MVATGIYTIATAELEFRSAPFLRPQTAGRGIVAETDRPFFIPPGRSMTLRAAELQMNSRPLVTYEARRIDSKRGHRGSFPMNGREEHPQIVHGTDPHHANKSVFSPADFKTFEVDFSERGMLII
jgi:hypothetical protein